jgi:antitoxin component of MazEF toxin-antitoxin module
MSAAIHLPWALLVRLGFGRGDRLEGKWEVRRGFLLLRVRRRGRWRR